MVSSRVCFPAELIGGFLSVPVCVRSPVVKNKTLWNERNSGESKILPSFDVSVWKPCFLPRSVTTVSTMLNFPSLRFTTSCSKPEDFVNMRRDFDLAKVSWTGNVAAALASAAVFKKTRRLAGLFTFYLLERKFYL